MINPFFRFMLPAASAGSTSASEYPLSVAASGRTLERDGQIFFPNFDTCWFIGGSATQEQAADYLDNVVASGFNGFALMVGQYWLMADGWNNAYGNPPFDGPAAANMNAAYWAHLAWIIDQAAQRGLYVLFVIGGPARIEACWKDPELIPLETGWEWHGPMITTQQAAADYGTAVGNFFSARTHWNVVWCLGCDCFPESIRCTLDATEWGAMAAAMQAALGSDILMTYHPTWDVSGTLSSDYFQSADWCNVAGGQVSPAKFMGRAYDASPTRPALFLEGIYEDDADADLTPWHIRCQAWAAIGYGACGHTYGHTRVFGAYGEKAVALDWGYQGTKTFAEALDAEGRMDMQHLGAFFSAHTDLLAAPYQDLLLNVGTYAETTSPCAALSTAADKAMVFVPQGAALRLALTEFAETDSISWKYYNPRTGALGSVVGYLPRAAVVSIPAYGTVAPANDWVMLLEASAQAADTGYLAGSLATPAQSQTYTISTLGTLDWSQWGYGGSDWADWAEGEANTNHKSGVTRQISAVTDPTHQAQTFTPGTTARMAVSWTGGTPTASASTVRTFIIQQTASASFVFTVTADTTEKILTVYCGGGGAVAGRLSASLSDSSAAAIQLDYTGTADTFCDRIATIRFRAATAGQTLTVTLLHNGGTNEPNVSLLAATLATAS